MCVPPCVQMSTLMQCQIREVFSLLHMVIRGTPNMHGIWPVRYDFEIRRCLWPW